MGFAEDAQQLAKKAAATERQAIKEARGTMLMPLVALVCLILGVVMCTSTLVTIDQRITEQWGIRDGARERLVREPGRGSGGASARELPATDP